jgi:hypothetical protein
MIPLTSPIVMLMRIPFSTLWQIAISVSFYLRPSFSSLVCSKNISLEFYVWKETYMERIIQMAKY